MVKMRNSEGSESNNVVLSLSMLPNSLITLGIFKSIKPLWVFRQVVFFWNGIVA